MFMHVSVTLALEQRKSQPGQLNGESADLSELDVRATLHCTSCSVNVTDGRALLFPARAGESAFEGLGMLLHDQLDDVQHSNG